MTLNNADTLPNKPSELFNKISRQAGRDAAASLWREAGEPGLEAAEALLAAVELQSPNLIRLIYNSVKNRSLVPELDPARAPALLTLCMARSIEGLATSMIELLSLCEGEPGAFEAARERAQRLYQDDSFLFTLIANSVLRCSTGHRGESALRRKPELTRAMIGAFWDACPPESAERVAKEEEQALTALLSHGRTPQALDGLLIHARDSAIAMGQKAALEAAVSAPPEAPKKRPSGL